MSPSNKVLFVTYSFPPDAAVGGKRIARFCRYLPEFGITPAILTIQERFYNSTDHSYAIPRDVELIRTTAVSNPLDWYRTLAMLWRRQPDAKSGRHSAFDSRGRSNLYEMLRRNVLLALQTPDRSWGWYWPAVRSGIAFVRKEGVPVIISSGPPWTSHLVARGIKRKTGIAWIADFRDPWTLNDWRTPLPNWLERIDQRLERNVIVESDRVVCVTAGMAKSFRSKYSSLRQEKFVTITNGIDDEGVSLPRTIAKGPVHHLVHLGSMYGDRRLRPLLQALLQLICNSSINPNQVHISFAGTIDQVVLDEAKAELSALQQFGIVELCGLIPYQRAQDLLASADLLLLIQGRYRDSVPAKFFEYLATGKPMLVLTKPGALSDLVDDTGMGVCVDPDSPGDIAQQLLRGLQSAPSTSANFERMLQRFHFRRLTQQLAELIVQAAGSDFKNGEFAVVSRI